MASYRFRSEKYVSRGFKDLAISLNSNPSTGDFGVVRNENAIKQSVRNLICTMYGERPFQDEIGSRVRELLFEPWDPFSVDSMKGEIYNCLARLEPRIEVTKIDLRDDSEINSIQVAIDYTIVGQEIQQSVDFLLERA
jgi:phage baseplate assembly protein W|tara:strand:- start:1739 stop:2152 length:414 start_codon:yes stop_codon:yes gene_type:complete